jgi:adenosylcobinamide-phosphate synthase
VHAFLVYTLGWIGGVLAFAWHVLILYATLGFRQFSHHFSAITQALDSGDEAKAVELLAAWKRVDVAAVLNNDVLRLTLEHAVVASHRHVFGVLGWYAVLAALGLGPAGAVLYRMAEFTSRYFESNTHEDLYASSYHAPDGDFAAVSTSPRLLSEAAQSIAQTAWRWIDYLPARMTAIGFAIVGNFEDVVDAWRAGLMSEPNLHNDSLIQIAMRAALSVKGDLQTAHVQSLVGLVWRSVVLWLLLIALLRLANLFG